MPCRVLEINCISGRGSKHSGGEHRTCLWSGSISLALFFHPRVCISLMKGLADFNLCSLHFTVSAPLCFKFVPVEVAITSELPLGSGLGSSAAFCVALSAALLALSGSVNVDREHHGWMVYKEDELDLLNKWAFEGEKIIHGKPSGIDNTGSTYD